MSSKHPIPPPSKQGRTPISPPVPKGKSKSTQHLDIGHAARQIREASGLSQRAAATSLGISHVYVNNIENGHCSPTVQIVERYFHHFGVDLYLLAVANSDCSRMTPAQKINYRYRLKRGITVPAKYDTDSVNDVFRNGFGSFPPTQELISDNILAKESR